jgi:hypothetical protein
VQWGLGVLVSEKVSAELGQEGASVLLALGFQEPWVDSGNGCGIWVHGTCSWTEGGKALQFEAGDQS